MEPEIDINHAESSSSSSCRQKRRHDTNINPGTEANSKKKTPDQVLLSLQRTCSRMERAKSDIRRSLFRFGIDQKEGEKIIAKLEEDKYIDERRYADSFVREKSSLQKWSKRRIFQALILKGIPKEYIDSAISENIEESDETENLHSILKKRYDKIIRTTDDAFTIRRKLFTFAAGKGYDIDEINDQLDKICQK